MSAALRRGWLILPINFLKHDALCAKGTGSKRTTRAFHEVSSRCDGRNPVCASGNQSRAGASVRRLHSADHVLGIQVVHCLEVERPARLSPPTNHRCVMVVIGATPES